MPLLSLEKQPKELLDLFQKALTERVEIPFSTLAEGQRYRNRIYSFRRLLANAEGRVDGYESIMLMAPTARTYLDKERLVLVVYYEGIDYDRTSNSKAWRGCAFPNTSRLVDDGIL